MDDIKKIKTYKAEDWQHFDEEDEVDQETGITIAQVAVGEATMADGSVQYVIEPFYLDLLEEIGANRDEYKIFTIPGRIPHVFITRAGSVIMHNEQMMMLVTSIKDLFAAEDKKLLFNALCESVKRIKLDQCLSLRELTFHISRELGAEIPADFIKALLKDYYSNYRADMNISQQLGMYLSSLSFEEIRTMAESVASFRMTGEFRDEDTESLMDSFGLTPNEFEQAIASELFTRVIIGKVKA